MGLGNFFKKQLPLDKTLFSMGFSDDRQKMPIYLFNLDGVRAAGPRNHTEGNGLVEACNGAKVRQPLSSQNAMTTLLP